MIELRDNRLILRSPATHPDARTAIGFQRTLRIPDDDTEYPLPAGLGPFPLRHVEDHDVPDEWQRRGGVMLPMHQSEAMWISFGGNDYPWALKISAGKICAVTGEAFSNDLHGGQADRRATTGRAADQQDYVVVPEQPWLDGFSVGKGQIRQFVAMPLGSGYTAEEQVTGKAEWGGLQIVAFPMKADRWEAILAERRARAARMKRAMPSADSVMAAPMVAPMAAAGAPAMGMGLGGRMRQVIHADPHGLDAWDPAGRVRCFVHLCNSQMWRQYTGEQPPTTPPTSTEYEKAGLPWFSLYEEAEGSAGGGGILSKLKSVVSLSGQKGDAAVADNTSVTPTHVTPIKAPGEVTDGEF